MTISTERAARKGFTLRDAWREFWKHPSPWVIGGTLAAALPRASSSATGRSPTRSCRW